MYGNGRPLGMKKRMQLVVIVVLLAWATQTLLHQWGFGAEVPATQDQTEKFVPGVGSYAGGATLELRGDATILGAEVKLRQVCRWSDSDAAVFQPVADLVVARINHGSPFRSITIDQIRATLHDAGMNLAVVRFAGPLTCTVTRSDSSYDEQTALRQWADAKESHQDDTEAPGHRDTETKLPPSTSSPVSPSADSHVSASSSDENAPKTLRSLLVDDLSTRLSIPKEQLQVDFNPSDEKLLNLSQPLFKFNIDPRQVRDLGEVSWNIQVISGTGVQKGTIVATARQWQNQIVLSKPVAYQQVIQDGDVTERRVLVDRLPYDTLLAMPQIVGQQASRPLTVGTVFNSHMVNAVPLVKPGQLVTITLRVGAVQIKTVARAMEEGSYGQAVKVRNEETHDVFEVVMTAPQEGTMGPLQGGTTLATAEIPR